MAGALSCSGKQAPDTMLTPQKRTAPPPGKKLAAWPGAYPVGFPDGIGGEFGQEFLGGGIVIGQKEGEAPVEVLGGEVDL